MTPYTVGPLNLYYKDDIMHWSQLFNLLYYNDTARDNC